MNKSQLINQLAKKLELPEKQIEKILNEIINAIIKSLKKGQKVTISGFGTFSITRRKERMGINPQTRQRLKIAATKTPKFTCGKPFKRAIQ